MKQCGRCDFDIDCKNCGLNGKSINFRKNKRRVRLFFKWYDIWVGVFIDTKNRFIYICPLPMLVIRISY